MRQDGDGEDDEGEDGAEDAGADDESGEGAALKRELRELSRIQFPYARVLKVMKLQDEVGNVNKLAGVVVNKALECFVERCVLEAASFTARKGRKTIYLKDVLGSMKAHANPEAMQHFVEEFQIPPPPAEPKKKPKKRASGAKKKEAAKPGAAEAAGAAKAEGAAAPVPPKKRGRGAAKPAEEEEPHPAAEPAAAQAAEAQAAPAPKRGRKA